MPTRPKRTSRPARRRGAVDDPVTAYARQVVAGEILTGRPVRLACERHLRDLKRRDLVWDLAAATRSIKFFHDVLRLNGGEFEGKPFDLTPTPAPEGGHWQAFVVGSLFGWKQADGTRRFRVAYIEIAKGNGKSPLAAGVGHLMLVADNEPRAEVYAAATKKDQAMILFRDAVAMRDQSPALSKRLTKSGAAEKAWNLGYPEKGSFFRPISSDDGQSGPRPHCGLIDELHEHKTSTVVDMMRAGTKSRRQALIFEITNAGWDKTTVCWAHHEYSLKVLEGLAENDQWFGYIATLDACDDCRAAGKTAPTPDCEACDKWTDESVWVKANPNLGVSIGMKYLREQVREAQGMPTKENIVRRLNFTEWTEQETIWIPADAWYACADPAVTFESMRGRQCFVGLDLSQSDDLTAAGFWFPPFSEGEPARAIVRYWIPGDNIAARAAATQMPYDLWVQRGLVEVTQGNVTDYDVIRVQLGALRELYQLQVIEVPFDPSGALQLSTQLTTDGFQTVAIQQTTTFFDPVMTYFENLVQSAGLRHDGHPVTNWHLSNVAPSVDARLRKRPDKARSRNKIDGIVALLMAAGRAMVKPAEPASVYETRGILTS